MSPLSTSYSILSNIMPVSLPSSMTKRLGRVVDDDFDVLLFGVLELPLGGLEEPRGLRAMTFTLLAPRRSEVRQQSIAVLPTPMISTRSPILSICPKATDSSQAMPMWMRSVSSRPGSSSSLPLGAPIRRTRHRSPALEQRRRLSTGELSQVRAHVR